MLAHTEAHLAAISVHPFSVRIKMLIVTAAVDPNVFAPNHLSASEPLSARTDLCQQVVVMVEMQWRDGPSGPKPGVHNSLKQTCQLGPSRMAPLNRLPSRHRLEESTCSNPAWPRLDGARPLDRTDCAVRDTPGTTQSS